MPDLKVTLIQADLAWEDIDANLAAFEKRISDLSDETHLIVLPEMFTTGFSMNPMALAEDMQGRTVAWLREMARGKGAAVVGGAMIREGERYVNRLLWASPDGRLQWYDKRHLIGIAGEDRAYSPGWEKLIVSVRGWRICPFICYDLRFPIWLRNLERPPYDLALFIANWPAVRAYHWRTLLLARAIENQCFVVGVNRVGTDGNGHDYCGDSAVIDPLGNILFQKKDVPAVHTATLPHAIVEECRRTFPVLEDADR